MSDCKNPKLRSAGILFPVFSMRRDGDLGIGDTTAVKQCIDWFSENQVGFLQLLPINVTGGDRSPYSSISSVALDPIYLDLEKITGVGKKAIEAARKECGTSLNSASVNYAKVWAVKSRVLSQAYQKFLKSETQGAKLEAYKESHKAWIENYCSYRWLMDEAGASEDWTSWPKEYNTPIKAKRYEKKRRAEGETAVQQAQDYYAWEQWHAFQQWEAVRAHADKRGVKLMGDVPIGVSYASADVFFEPKWFNLDWCGGAPPETNFKADPFTAKWGQNWGVPVYRWDVIEKSKYKWWRQRVGALTSIFHQFRIDHILGFYRIYGFPWHPSRNGEFLDMSLEEAAKVTGGALPGFVPRDDDSVISKAKNLLDGDKYIRAVIEAAGDGEVIGEDLGVVPDYVRPHLLELGVAGFKVVHWELQANGKVTPADAHPECSFACYTTHDMPPLKTLWESTRSAAEDGPDKRDARATMKILAEFSGQEVMRNGKPYPAYSKKVKHALLDSLLSTSCRYACIQIGELIDSSVQVNFPGTVGDHNWTYRTSWSVTEPSKVVNTSMKSFSKMIEVHDRA